MYTDTYTCIAVLHLAWGDNPRLVRGARCLMITIMIMSMIMIMIMSMSMIMITITVVA